VPERGRAGGLARQSAVILYITGGAAFAQIEETDMFGAFGST